MIAKILLLKQLYLRRLIGEEYCQSLSYDNKKDISLYDKTLNEIIDACMLCNLCKTCNNKYYGLLEGRSRLVFITLRPILEHTNSFEMLKNIATNVFKTNCYSALSVIKCNTSADVLDENILVCKEYLQRQLSSLNPTLIVLFGMEVAKSLIDIDDDFDNLRCRVLDSEGFKSSFIITYSINDMLLNSNFKKIAFKDFTNAIKLIGDVF